MSPVAGLEFRDVSWKFESQEGVRMLAVQGAVANVAIVAGNTPPMVSPERPVDGGFFAWGDEIPFQLAVTDAEDGSTASGTISCADVTFQPSVGHADHGQPRRAAHAGSPADDARTA